MMMDKEQVMICEEEIQEMLYVELHKAGFAPGKTEVETLAQIFFDYLLEKDAMELKEEDEY